MHGSSEAEGARICMAPEGPRSVAASTPAEPKARTAYWRWRRQNLHRPARGGGGGRRRASPLPLAGEDRSFARCPRVPLRFTRGYRPWLLRSRTRAPTWLLRSRTRAHAWLLRGRRRAHMYGPGGAKVGSRQYAGRAEGEDGVLAVAAPESSPPREGRRRRSTSCVSAPPRGGGSFFRTLSTSSASLHSWLPTLAPSEPKWDTRSRTQPRTTASRRCFRPGITHADLSDRDVPYRSCAGSGSTVTGLGSRGTVLGWRLLHGRRPPDASTIQLPRHTQYAHPRPSTPLTAGRACTPRALRSPGLRRWRRASRASCP